MIGGIKFAKFLLMKATRLSRIVAVCCSHLLRLLGRLPASPALSMLLLLPLMLLFLRTFPPPVV